MSKPKSGLTEQVYNTKENSSLLRNTVQESMCNYFSKLGGALTHNLYDMVITEVEEPLLEAVMRYSKGNQSKASAILGISRGTLRKKLKLYGFLD
jgi:Fis family transcriptional regulator, factor for inversion stimulation protein